MALLIQGKSLKEVMYTLWEWFFWSSYWEAVRLIKCQDLEAHLDSRGYAFYFEVLFVLLITLHRMVIVSRQMH